jgi:molybdopterin-guanine dinucleotide biosynthesis protein A
LLAPNSDGNIATMTHGHATAAVVLAGGQSRRMGRPKEWLDMGGTPLLRHVVDVIRTCCATVVVVGSPGQKLPPLGPGVLRIDDPPERAHEGPLAGTVTGLRTPWDHEETLVYLGSCDSALLTRAHVEFVLTTLAEDDHVDAVVPVEGPGGRVHTLASAVRAPVARSVAEKLFDSGKRKITSLFAALRTDYVPVAQLPDPRAVTTCNTPAEWRAVSAIDKGRR